MIRKGTRRRVIIIGISLALGVMRSEMHRWKHREGGIGTPMH